MREKERKKLKKMSEKERVIEYKTDSSLNDIGFPDKCEEERKRKKEKKIKRKRLREKLKEEGRA